MFGNSDVNISFCSPRQSFGNSLPIVVSSSRPEHYPQDHVLIRVDRFGFSANNMTYEALGEHPHFRYFDFHTVPEVEGVTSKTHGLTPVWGFGTVVGCNHPKIQLGERVYGYLAPARYVLLHASPSDVNKFSFYVLRPHLPSDRRPYNQIIRCSNDPQYTPTPVGEDLTMLYRPLFWTSYWCEDWLYSSSYRGGVSIILISSASSKTAFCLAYLIRKRIVRGDLDKNVKIVALTSPRNVSFTQKLGFYDEVLQYDSFNHQKVFQGKRDARWIYVDVAGNTSLNRRIFDHFASPYTGRLAACISLGLTNLSPSTSNVDLNWSTNSASYLTQSSSTSSPPQNMDTSAFWPEIEQFFMPEWLNIRRLQIPVTEIVRNQNIAWKELLEDGAGWVQIERVNGPVKVQEAYKNLQKNGLGPEKGLIWSLWHDEEKTLAARL